MGLVHVQTTKLVVEEAEKLVDAYDNSLGVSDDIFMILANESREYGIRCVIINQTPSKLPFSLLCNMSMHLVHRLGNKDDVELMTSIITTRPNMNSKDMELHLTKQSKGQCIIKEFHCPESHSSSPFIVKIKQPFFDIPSDEELVFRLGLKPSKWMQLKLKEIIN